MANKRLHIGIIKPTVPLPRVYFGSIQGIADKCGISYRTACNLIKEEGYITKSGYRRMTEEEEETYYEPPPPPPPRKTSPQGYQSKRSWRVVFHRNWKRGYALPEKKEDRFIGSPQEFVRFVNCNLGQVYRLMNTHQGLPEKYKLKSVKGWSIYRIYKKEPSVNKKKAKGVTIAI